MGQEEEKIIKEIKDFFSDHQERYEEGTWEEFRIKYEKRYKSRVKFLHPLSIKWKAVAAAAVLLVVLMQYFRGDVSERTETIKDRKSTRLNSSHVRISYAVFCLKKKKQKK